MASLLLTSHSSSLFSLQFPSIPRKPNHHPLSITIIPPKTQSPFRIHSTNPQTIPDEWGEKPEKPEPETSYTDADPPLESDEWGVDVGNDNGTSSSSSSSVVGDLKMCLVDTVFGSGLGFDASSEIRAEVIELVNQLESNNPIKAPMEATAVLDGNWVLVYTAFSELYPLLALGQIPLVKVEKICQSIDTSNMKIDNSVTISSRFATFSFTATASFEVRSPSRIQVEFKEGTLQPPKINSSINFPENLDVFGQSINLLPIQQSLNPLQDIVAEISRALSGQPPLKVPIPGNRTASSWLLTTYLDEDLRISRGDGGLFVLVKEGSPLLDMAM